MSHHPSHSQMRQAVLEEPQEWTLVFFEERGGCPVKEFLARLDAKAQARFMWSLDQLRERNIQAKWPLVRRLEEGIWELREESNTNIYRLAYFFDTGRRIVLLFGFQKKTEDTPRHVIELAKEMMWRFLQGREAPKP